MEDLAEYIDKYSPIVSEMIIDGEMSNNEVAGLILAILDIMPKDFKENIYKEKIKCLK